MKLPPHCRVRGPSVYLVKRQGDKVPWVKLGRVTDGELAIWRAYRALESPTPHTMEGIIEMWLEKPHDLKPNTLREYSRQLQRVLPVFGHVTPANLKPSHIAMYLELRGNVSANREVAALSTVCEWAMRKGYMEANPCRGVRRNRERPRHRYIRDDEWQDALDRAPPQLRDLMEAAYLTGLRQGDLLAMTREQVTDDGLLVEEGKRGKRLVIGWSDALRLVISRALVYSECERVFTNASGQAWRFWALQSAMRRLGAEFTFHDIRAKAESDHAEGMGLMARYKRAKRVEPVR